MDIWQELVPTIFGASYYCLMVNKATDSLWTSRHMKAIFTKLVQSIVPQRYGVTPRWIGWLNHITLKARCERYIGSRPYSPRCENVASVWTQKFWKPFI